MPRWRRLQVPGICERMIGFSVPQDDTVLVISYEGMHLVRLGSFLRVETDPEHSEYDLYYPDTGVRHSRGKAWEIIGSTTSISGCSRGPMNPDEGEHLMPRPHHAM